MMNIGKYTELFSILHPLTLILIILFSSATPQGSKAFADESDTGIKVLTKPQTPKALAGEFIVGFNTKEDVLALGKTNQPEWLTKLGAGVQINRTLADFGAAHIQVTNPAGSGQWENLADILSSDPTVSYVEPNYIKFPTQVRRSDDPLARQMWHMDTILAYESWQSLPEQSDPVIVAVIDSGIHGFHDDLRGKIWVNTDEIVDNGVDDDKNGYIDDVIGWNFYANDNLPLAYLHPHAEIEFDDQGNPFCNEKSEGKSYEAHGTHVAATIAAMENNGIGGSGVAPNVQIMMLKSLGGPCGLGSTISSLQSALYAYQNGARIINMSLGGTGYSKLADRVYGALSELGVLIIAAAGNEGLNTDRTGHYPSGFGHDGILSVGASTRSDRIANFSNRGAQTVDLFAPGQRILNAIPGGQGDTPESSYAALSGTSMATPIVAGAAALIWAHDPSLTNLEVKAKLMNGTDAFEAMRGQSVTGGRLNILSALKASTEKTHPDPAPAPPGRTPDPSFGGGGPGGGDDLGGIRIFDNRSR